MAKNKVQKKKLVKEYQNKIEASKGFIVLKPNKLTPNEVNEFRKEVYDFGASFNIVKNTLFKLALKDAGVEGLGVEGGEYSILFLGDNYINAAKSLKKFIETAKTKEKEDKLTIVTGYLENSVLTKAQVVDLSEMPDTKTSVAMILGILDNAMSGIVNVLEDSPRSIATILDLAFKDKQ
ncbi:MAG: 50S ribosomal protein L10 [Candidatus Dojkabacteria bacterium]